MEKDGIFFFYQRLWSLNLVVVRKKNGKICLCVDFHDVNQEFLKDNYPLPNMEYLLQQVLG